MGASGIPEEPQKLGEFLMSPDKSENKKSDPQKILFVFKQTKKFGFIGGKKNLNLL